MKVRDVLSVLYADGWRQTRQRGSHRVLKHPTKPGIVVVPGHDSDEMAAGTLKSVWQQARIGGKP